MQSTIERLSMAAFAQIEKEVGALIGTDLELSLVSASLTKKQGFLENQDGSNSIIGLQLRGRYEGEGCLVVAEDCAVRLAGKMLMLPSTELNDIICEGNYADEEELSYAFDDIAKCLVVAFLDTFQRSSNFISTITCQSQRFTEGRKEVAEILSHLSTDQTYYQVSGTMTLAGVTTNTLSLLLPAFVLVCSEPFKKHTGQQVVTNSVTSDIQNHEQAGLVLGETPLTIIENENDPLLPHLRPALQKELSNVLGITVQVRVKGSFSGPLFELIRGTDTSPQLRSRITISGPGQNHGWLITTTSDAMKLGLLLTEGTPGLTIPGSLAGGFNADCQDGYQEVCSIFMDVIDLVCNDLSEDDLFMQKDTDIEEIDLKTESVDRIDDKEQTFMLTLLEIVADTIACGTMHILLPIELYETLKTVEPDRSLESIVSHGQEVIDEKPIIDASNTTSLTELSHHADVILLIEDSPAYGPEILNSFKETGIKAESISLADEFSTADMDSYLAVLLVQERLDEIGLGVVIKIKSTSSVPLLVAASLWTQTDVMKALRYGVDDIIMLPVESDELLRKLRGKEPLSV
ncbi:MAG: response regulator transcription factor [Desulfofustis sp.]|nr:response regulator transcription factor [Desulfofustis sp.]